MDLRNRFKYIFHFDEITWMPNVINRPFNKINVAYIKRGNFMEWLDKYTSGNVYVWPGLVTPDPFQSNWGNMVSPAEDSTFIIFEEDSDQTRFALEFVGNPVGMSAYVYKNGMDAYYSQKR